VNKSKEVILGANLLILLVFDVDSAFIRRRLHRLWNKWDKAARFQGNDYEP